MTVVPLEYIEVDDRGVARLIGSRIKVRHVAGYARAGWPVGKIHDSYPHLTLAQIHAALAYYYDHQTQIDTEIDEGARLADELRANNPNRFTREEVVARWKEKFPDRPFPTAEEPEDT